MRVTKARLLLLPCWAALVLGAACGSFSPETGASETDGGAEGGAPDVASLDGATCNPATLDSDVANCGRCQHSCLGGACKGGVCQPFVVGSSGPEAVVDLALDTSRILWSTTLKAAWNDPGGLYACPRSGCGKAAPTSLLPAPKETGSLTGDGTDAYFSLVYGNKEIDKVNANLSPLPIPPHANAVRLQLRDSKLYYLARQEGSDSGLGGTVYSWTSQGESSIASRAVSNLLDLVVTGSHVFVADPINIYTCEMVPGGCPTTTLFASSTSSIRALATDGARLFWGTGDNVVLSRPVAGPAAQQSALLTTANDVRNVTFAAGTVYVTTSANEIFACDPVTGCAAGAAPFVRTGPLFDGTESVFGHALTADSEAVYWSESADGGASHRILKLAK